MIDAADQNLSISRQYRLLNINRSTYYYKKRPIPKLLHKYDSDFLRPEEPYDVYDLPDNGEAEVYHDLFVKHGVQFKKGRRHIDTIEVTSDCQAELLCFVANSEKRGLVRIPRVDKECKRLKSTFTRFINNRQLRLVELIEERTADEGMQEKILDALLLMVRTS